MSLSQTSAHATVRHTETGPIASGGDPHVSLTTATGSRAPADHDDKLSQSQQQSQFLPPDERFSQSDPRSAEGSQASNATTVPDRVFTPTPTDDTAMLNPEQGPSHASQLQQLSAIAAAQDRMATAGYEWGSASRKRMADGEVKSPIKGHSRNTSTMSMASTTSTIGDLSSELRTRLSYAMVKVNNGWQAHSLDEVESLASQAVSPSSSTSTTMHRRKGSSASPRMGNRPMTQLNYGGDYLQTRRKSSSPPTLANRPTLAPPAPIRPSGGSGVSNPHPRRNSNPNYTPTLLSNSRTASPRTPAQPPALNTAMPRGNGAAEAMMYSPHQNVREQDAIETLLFMSSPNNSSNLKHTFSPAGSPGPGSQPAPRSTARQSLPIGPRKALPSQRPLVNGKRVGFETGPGMSPISDTHMEMDSPQQSYVPVKRAPARRRFEGSGHMRGALSLPSALGISHMTHRQPMSDRDIDIMLDRRDEDNNSSDDEEIPLPQRRGQVSGAIEAR